jgi:hypothetical protein
LNIDQTTQMHQRPETAAAQTQEATNRQQKQQQQDKTATSAHFQGSSTRGGTVIGTKTVKSTGIIQSFKKKLVGYIMERNTTIQGHSTNRT